MKIVDEQFASEWCRAHGIPTRNNGLPDVEGTLNAENFSIPNDAGQRTAMVKEQMRTLLIDSCCLIWINDWSVWPSGQWQHLFDRFRLSYGYSEPLIKKPAHLVDKDEYDAATSIAVYSVLMLWDCYVISDKGSWLYYSHDEYGLAKM